MILILYNVAVIEDGDIFVCRGSVKAMAWRDMAPTDDGRHVFIVRIWFEPREIDGAAPLMRGTIEHLPSGMRGGVIALRQITAFIRSRLRESGELPVNERPRRGGGDVRDPGSDSWRHWNNPGRRTRGD